MSVKSLRKVWKHDKKQRQEMESFLCTRYEVINGEPVVTDQHYISRDPS